jgi:CBS domain-containing protein
MDNPPIIKYWMKQAVITVQPGTLLRDAAALIVEKRVGTLPVVDDAGTLNGVVHLRDIIQIFLPNFVTLLSDIDFVKDFGAQKSPTTGRLREAEVLTVGDIMEKPVAVEEDTSLIRALSLMEKHNISDLLVVKEGKLVGLASRVDIGRAFLANWKSPKPGKPKGF